MSTYDPAIHSKSKLGIIGNVPVSPFPATEAQVRTGNGALHLRVMGQYITGTLRGAIPPARIKATMKAMEMCPAEESWSGSDSIYRHLTVEGDGATGIQRLMAGEFEVCKIAIDPAWTLISSDEPIQSQIDADPDSGDSYDDDNA